jgi:zinc transporter
MTDDSTSEGMGLIEALVLDGKGGARKIGRAEIDSFIPAPHETLWLHWDRSHEQTQQWLRAKSGLSQFDCDLLLEENTRPRIVLTGQQHVLLFLRGINLQSGSEPADMISMRVYADKQRVISLRLRALRARVELSEELLSGKGPTSSPTLLLRLAELLTQKIDPVIAELSETVDHEDEQLEANEDYQPDHSKMSDTRRRSAGLRRFLAPQRDIFFEFTKDKFSWFVGDQARGWNELGNSLTRHLEELELIRERVSLVLESEHQRTSEKMNRVMYMFAIVTGFFLPLSFLTGLFGINLAGMPGSENPHSFVEFCLLIAVIGLFQWWLFRRLKWLL